jgi:glycosyltransferase involved in cell wall biosynthesis
MMTIQMKKVAFVIHSLDVLFNPEGIKGGANILNLALLEALASHPAIELTLITLAGKNRQVAGVDHYFFFDKSIYTDKAYVLDQISAFLAANPHDRVLFSDVIAPFGDCLLQSHSIAHRRAGESWWLRPFTSIISKKRHQAQVLAMGDVTNRQFFTVSQAIKTDYVRHFGLDANHVHVAYPGVTLPKTKKETSPPLPRNPLVFGMVNTSSLNKGGLLFLMALALLKLSGKPFSVRMIHPKLAKDFFTKVMIVCLGLQSTITILPFQKEMTPFYASIDALVLPSLNEAFGLVVTEAMSHGVIPVVSSTAGVAEIIQHGVTGFVFNRTPQPVWALFQLLQKLTLFDTDVTDRIKVRIVESVQKQTWQRFAKTIINQL